MQHEVITTTGNSTVYAGQSHTLTCTVIADFPHNTTWFGNNGAPLTNDSLSGVIIGEPTIDGITTRLTLTFTTVTTSQAGQYSCYSVMDFPASTSFSVQDLFVISKFLLNYLWACYRNHLYLFTKNMIQNVYLKVA